MPHLHQLTYRDLGIQPVSPCLCPPRWISAPKYETQASVAVQSLAESGQCRVRVGGVRLQGITLIPSSGLFSMSLSSFASRCRYVPVKPCVAEARLLLAEIDLTGAAA